MLFQAVTSLRSIFCHNNSLCYPLNEDVLQRAENSISEYLPNAPDIEDITETQWTILLQKLCTAADDFRAAGVPLSSFPPHRNAPPL